MHCRMDLYLGVYKENVSKAHLGKLRKQPLMSLTCEMPTRIFFPALIKVDIKICCRERRRDSDFSSQCRLLTFNTGTASPALLLARNRSFLTHHGEEHGSVLIISYPCFPNQSAPRYTAELFNLNVSSS